MKNIKNDYCIKMYTDSGNNLRPAFNEISLKDGYVYATNSHIVGKIKADLCVKSYKEVEGFPNAESIFLQHKSIESKTLSVDSIFNELVKIECCFKPKMVECDDCNGSGNDVCWHCDSKIDCEHCNGSGEKESNELELTSEYQCNLFNKSYTFKYLDIIIKTAVILGEKEIIISNAEGNSGTLFTIGDFSIILMPCAKFD